VFDAVGMWLLMIFRSISRNAAFYYFLMECGAVWIEYVGLSLVFSWHISLFPMKRRALLIEYIDSRTRNFLETGGYHQNAITMASETGGYHQNASTMALQCVAVF